MVERDSEPLAATVFGDQRAVVMRPLAEDDRASRLAMLKTGAAEAPVSCPIMWLTLTFRGGEKPGPCGILQVSSFPLPRNGYLSCRLSLCFYPALPVSA